MSDSFNCNFAWCAIQCFECAHFTKSHILPRGALPTIVREYNAHFTNEINLQVNYVHASKRFVTISKRSNDKWHPQEKRDTFLSTFNTEVWQSLSQDQRDKHTLSDCKECQERYPDLSNAFPAGVRRGKKRVQKLPETIRLTKEDLSSPQALGSKVLRELTRKPLTRQARKF